MAAAAVGYCVYFDRKRRSAAGFKEAHREKRKMQEVAAQKAADAAMEAKRAAAGAGGPPAGLAEALRGRQPPHPQKDQILAQCQTLSQEAHRKINEAGESNPMEIEAGLQMILQTVQMVSQLGDQNLMGQWISLQIKSLQQNGNQQAAMALQGALKQMFQPR